MKKLFVNMFAVVLLGSAGIASAQSRAQQSTDDGYLRQNGKIVEVRDGKLYPVNNNIGLANGITLLTDGTLIRQDGGRVALNNGQAVDRNGQLLTPRRDRDGNIILWPRRDDDRRDRDDDRRDRDDEWYGRDRDDRDRSEGNRSVGKGKNGKQGPPYGNAYGHYKNKDKKNKKDKDYKYSERNRRAPYDRDRDDD